MPRVPLKYREAFTRLKRATDRLHGLIESGEFYTYSYLKRRKHLRQVRRLYNKLAGPVSPSVVGSALTAAGVLTLAGCFPATNPPPSAEGPQTPSFAPYQASPFGLAQLTADSEWFHGPMVLADLDGDADLDMIHGAVLDAEGPYHRVAFRINSGTAASPVFSSIQYSGYYNLYGRSSASSVPPHEIVAAGDLDGDGDVDLISTYTKDETGPNTHYLYAYTNETTGSALSFGWPPLTIDSTTAHKVRTVALVDVDGDTKLDVVFMTAYSYNVYSALNTSTGPDAISFGTPTAGSDLLPDFDLEITDSYRNLEDIEITDLDQDGDLDVLVGVTYAEGSNPTIVHFDNQGTVPPTFEKSTDPFGLVVPERNWDESKYSWAELAITAADIDDDGDIDLMLGPNVETGDSPGEKQSTFYFLENLANP